MLIVLKFKKIRNAKTTAPNKYDSVKIVGSSFTKKIFLMEFVNVLINSIKRPIINIFFNCSFIFDSSIRIDKIKSDAITEINSKNKKTGIIVLK